jgi:hypothetical protein
MGGKIGKGSRVGGALLLAVAIAGCGANQTAPSQPATNGPTTLPPEQGIEPYGAICTVHLSTEVLAGFADVLYPNAGDYASGRVAETALTFLRQTRTRMARLGESFPDYAKRFNAALDGYEVVLQERASLPPGDAADALFERIQGAAGALKRVGDDAFRQVEECPAG